MQDCLDIDKIVNRDRLQYSPTSHGKKLFYTLREIDYCTLVLAYIVWVETVRSTPTNVFHPSNRKRLYSMEPSNIILFNQKLLISELET